MIFQTKAYYMYFDVTNVLIYYYYYSRKHTTFE